MGICPVGICPVGICPGVFVLESLGSVDWWSKFFNSSLKFTNKKRAKVTCLIDIKIDQSPMFHGKIASKDKMPLTAK